VCKNILDINNRVNKGSKETSSAEQNREIMERLLQYETNLMACIYRLVDTSVELNKIAEETKEETSKDLGETVKNRMKRFSTLIDKSHESLQKKNTLIQALFGMGYSIKLIKSFCYSLT
jgi:hypothetical protein